MGGLKCSYYGVLSAINDFFDQCDTNAATPMEEIYELQEGIFWKTKLIRLHSMNLSCSVNDYFSQLSGLCKESLQIVAK